MALVDEPSGVTVKQPMHDVHGRMPLQPPRSEAASVDVMTTKVRVLQGLIVAEHETQVR